MTYQTVMYDSVRGNLWGCMIPYHNLPDHTGNVSRRIAAVCLLYMTYTHCISNLWVTYENIHRMYTTRYRRSRDTHIRGNKYEPAGSMSSQHSQHATEEDANQQRCRREDRHRMWSGQERSCTTSSDFRKCKASISMCITGVTKFCIYTPGEHRDRGSDLSFVLLLLLLIA